ncbi:Mis12 protein-domain-containing protein [Protomyces lactucae-debilis]|uniref:Mis12 protein-domain-containing protein n=1 Tax=Protomyces lactucae-debilis TaxID=2754530 RepID=A0A1Y2FCD7_PROLT|nr:Mis12 protein-domain-containing protein [Protomyces lactucae-debilis]ORY81589.1 Mis12 protein-domain-containing protein [Protomyces lactucae-debilis]
MASFPEQEELISEHLTFAPLSLVDDIINTANALLYKAVNALEQLFQSLPPTVLPDEEAEAGIHKFETLLESSVDRNFDAMELYLLRNIVNIPQDVLPWIRLAHHEHAQFGAAAAGECAELDEELARTRKAYAASCKVKALLQRERAHLARKQALIQAHAQRLAFLHEKPVEYGVAPLQQSQDLVKDQAQALEKLLAETLALAEQVNVDLPVTERGKYLQKVLLETVKDGSFEKELAALGKIGSVDELQAAAELLKDA